MRAPPIAPPQFGAPAPGREHEDRPCAFGIAEKDGRIAVVRVGRPGEDQHYDLPGGALDPGEDEATALVREFGEETGLIVRLAGALGRADQLMVKKDGRAVNNRSALFVVEVVEEDPGLKVEADHRLVWLEPLEAVVRLRHPSHAWAVALWLRSSG